MLTLRFDMRSAQPGEAADLYAAALDMCDWMDGRTPALAVLSEHHGSDDGHLPVPLLMAAAIAARTRQLPIMLAAVVLPLYDPVRLAEEMAVLDLVSGGRVSYVLGVGHRVEEYEHFGVDCARRGAIADEHLALLLALLRGETVTHEGRRIAVTPRPHTPGGPAVLIGGGSPAAVRRAARFGLGFLGQTDSGGLRELYEQECRAQGREPGFMRLPDPTDPAVVFVAEDVDAAWAELGTYLLHDARAAAAWRQGDRTTASISHAQTVEELRADGSTHRILTSEQARAHLRSGRSLGLLPLCAGLSPAVAWPYLERAAAVAEAVAESTTASPSLEESPA